MKFNCKKHPSTFLILALIVFILNSCATRSTDSNTSETDDLSAQTESAAAAADQPANTAASAATGEEDPFADPPGEQSTESAANPETPPAEVPPAAETPLVTEAPAPLPEVEITNLKYLANESGGTVVVEATGPMNYVTRSNPELKQFIIEIPNSKLPAKLKRPLNTKDFAGTIGSIDAYQAESSKTSRIVVQLREGAVEPYVQAEGNAILIVATDPKSTIAPTTAATLESSKGGSESSGSTAMTETADENTDININLNDSRILSSQSLSEFLSGNTKFYGKKISIEFPASTPVQTAIRFFIEETGINMIIDPDVTGTVSMKLRQVPWDQAFITMLRLAKLTYQRQGSILRIATVKALQAEEKEAKEQADLAKLSQPLKVKNFYINFAKLNEVKTQIEDLLTKSDTGKSKTTKIVLDERNGKLVIQDVEENLELIDKIIKNLDMPTKQVLIEGKIVEATEKFSRGIGVQWGLSGQDYVMGAQTARIGLGVGTAETSGSTLQGRLSFGVLPVIGELQATLALSEIDNKVKIVASPRVMTMTDMKATMEVTTNIQTLKTNIMASGGAVTNSNQYDYTPIPITMQVTPKVTPDNFVTMQVKVNRSVGNVDSTGKTSIDSRSVDTSILVRDGQTAVIGGLYQTDTAQGVTGVPGLKDIPFIGSLFRSKSENRQKIELLIFLTPRIINQEMQSGGTASESTTL